MPRLAAGSVDLVLADVPYGQTQNEWDQPIPFGPMWEQLLRVAKSNAAIILMGAQPFASRLICSNLDIFRYDLIWKKNKTSGFLNSKKQPLRGHEHILVFYREPPLYTPQMTTGNRPGNYAKRVKHSTNYGAQTPTEYGGSTERHPTSIVEMAVVNNDSPDRYHPTQKPVDLMAWLIRSYSAPGETVLDFSAGVGTTALACIQEQRKCICIEKEQSYAEIANRRIAALLPEWLR